MTSAFETRALTKRFGTVTALDHVTLAVPEGSVAGLVGRNGGGKTTLLHHVTGFAVPTEGDCVTLGTSATRLGAAELGRIGVVHQEGRLLEWMTVRQHLRYVASFYTTWDRTREDRLVEALDLDPEAVVATLSPGNLQKVAVILAVGHHPSLLLLDEPTAGLDPIAREALLEVLLDLAREDGTTIVISSHLLHDVERVVDWLVCLEKGRLMENASLDDLKEVFAEWIVTTVDRALPDRFEEPFIVRQDVTKHQARLAVRNAADRSESFARRHGVAVESRPLNLDALFPLLIGGGRR